MTGEALSYLGLCVGAVVLAAHAPRGQRRAAVLLAGTLLANWLVCAWTYADASPQAFMRSVGVETGAIDIWATADMLLGIVAIVAGMQRWWGWAIWASCMAQLGMHAIHGLLGDAVYLFWLDKILLAQIAVFTFLGGRGVSDRLHGISWVRRLGASTKRGLAKVVST